MERDDQTHHADEEHRNGATDATETYQTNRDESVPQAVVTAVSSELDCAPTDLKPLNTAVDPDALDALFGATSSGSRDDGRVAFTYAECAVTVRSDGLVRIGTHD